MRWMWSICLGLPAIGAIGCQGRHDPLGPLGTREYLLNIDRYCGFVYHELIRDLLRSMNS